jgi:hypothetical protein
MPMHSACEENFSLKKKRKGREEKKKEREKAGDSYLVTRFFSVE